MRIESNRESRFFYFAADGSWGEANVEILDCSKWNDFDWKSVEDAPDDLRMTIARSICDRYQYGETDD